MDWKILIKNNIKSAPIYYTDSNGQKAFKILELTDIIKIIIDTYSDSDDKVFDDIAYIINNSPAYDYKNMTALDIATLSTDGTHPPNIAVKEGCKLSEILRSMEEHYVRRAYVVDDDGTVNSVVTQTSLLHTVFDKLNLVAGSILSKPLKDSHIINSYVKVVKTTDHVIEAFKKIIDGKISSVPVVENDVIKGYITMKDIVNVVRDNRFVRDLYKTTGEFLKDKRMISENLYLCLGTDSVELAIKKMNDNGLNLVWIVGREKDIRGIVSFSELLKSLV